jgi:hypothetical protein
VASPIAGSFLIAPGATAHKPLRSQICLNPLPIACTAGIDPKQTTPHVPQSGQSTPPAYENPHPIHIDLLGAEAILHIPNALAQLVQHTGGLQRRSAGFCELFITGHTSSIFGHQVGCKPLLAGTRDQLLEQRPTYRAGSALDITLGVTTSCPGALTEKSNTVRTSP